MRIEGLRSVRTLTVAAALCGMVTAAAWTTRHHGPTATFTPKGGATLLHVPHAHGDIALDGDMDDPGWLGGCARTAAFVTDDGRMATPYSDARLVWDDNYLYVALYAADIDIRAANTVPDTIASGDDSFHLLFETEAAEYSFDISAGGLLRDAIRRKSASGGIGHFDARWNSGAHVSVESDGTVNRPGDYDEEWVVEMAIPLAALDLAGEAGERIGFFAGRCDTLPNGEKSCGSWGRAEKRGVLLLDRGIEPGAAPELSSL